jgi:hypothetical protein
MHQETTAHNLFSFSEFSLTGICIRTILSWPHTDYRQSVQNEFLTVKQLWNAGKIKEIRVVNEDKPPQARYSSLQQNQIMSLQPEQFRIENHQSLIVVTNICPVITINGNTAALWSSHGHQISSYLTTTNVSWCNIVVHYILNQLSRHQDWDETRIAWSFSDLWSGLLVRIRDQN